MTQQETWKKLEKFEFDPTFFARLMNENGWTGRFTEQAIEEYKKFLFLAKFSGHPVTPSNVIDEVWHVHLLYTKSYWQKMCTDILNMSLHHDPSMGGSEEDAKHVDWYKMTLKSYKIAFGDSPAMIWPVPNVEEPTPALEDDDVQMADFVNRQVKQRSLWERFFSKENPTKKRALEKKKKATESGAGGTNNGTSSCSSSTVYNCGSSTTSGGTSHHCSSGGSHCSSHSCSSSSCSSSCGSSCGGGD